MKDESKTREQLVDELIETRRRIAELEALGTEWREAEKALRESEEGCWDLVENANDFLQSIAPDGRFLYVNRTWREALGYSQQEIASLSLFDIIHPDSQDHCIQVFQRVLSGEEADRVEAVFVAKDGREILVEGNVNCKLVGGKPAYTRGIFRDVTERKRAQEAVRESERRYRLLAENVTDVIWTSDINLRFTYLSSSITRLTGHTVEEAMILAVEGMLTPASFEVALETLHEELAVEATGGADPLRSRTLELEVNCKDGSTVWTEVKLTFLRDTDGQPSGMLGVARDITERKGAEEELKAAQEYAQSLIDSSLDMIISVDKDRRIVEFNVAAQNTFGYSKAEVLGKQVDILYAHPAEGLNVHKTVLKTGQFTGEIVNKRKNGETFPSYLAASAMEDENGKFLGLMGISRDITERKMAEEKLQSHYERERELRQRLEAEIETRAQFTRGLVHELKTPLTPILASGQLLVDELQGGPLLRVAENISRGASRLDKRVDELLDLARGELGLLKLNLEQVDLLQLLRSVADDMAPLASSREESIVLEVPSLLPSVWADEGRLEQVVLNLLSNALKWTPTGGKVTLLAREDDGSLIVEVQDTGPGIPDEEQQQVFDAYYRRESDRQRLDGLGLGLSLCKTIVDLHGGKIWVESRKGEGSTFSFSVPLHAADDWR